MTVNLLNILVKTVWILIPFLWAVKSSPFHIYLCRNVVSMRDKSGFIEDSYKTFPKLSDKKGHLNNVTHVLCFFDWCVILKKLWQLKVTWLGKMVLLPRQMHEINAQIQIHAHTLSCLRCACSSCLCSYVSLVLCSSNGCPLLSISFNPKPMLFRKVPKLLFFTFTSFGNIVTSTLIYMTSSRLC